jgi:hypothetical protein
MQTRYGAPDLLLSSSYAVPTARHGSGLNFFTFFDNMAGWNKDWGLADVEGAIYVNDVVISDTRIGHDYSVGRPKPPSNLVIQ